MMMGIGMGLWSLIGTLIFWGLLIAGAIWVVKQLFPSVPSSASMKDQTAQSAGAILKERYARGELTQEQYQQMQKTLQQ